MPWEAETPDARAPYGGEILSAVGEVRRNAATTTSASLVA
jgi:hypothetical protein